MDFKLTYWTRRWSSNTTLTVQKFEAGWHISHVTIYSDADREGAPFLESSLHQDHGKQMANTPTELQYLGLWCPRILSGRDYSYRQDFHGPT
jgi:hypothetical protein